MNEHLKFDRAGIDLVKASEGLRLKAYRDPVGILTIGYGHTGSDVREGQTLSEQEAVQLLMDDVRFAEVAVKAYVNVPISQNQYDALVDFTFNVGVGALQSSTLLKKLNAGDYIGAGQEFHRWNKAGGKVLPGLTKRRASEAALFGT